MNCRSTSRLGLGTTTPSRSERGREAHHSILRLYAVNGGYSPNDRSLFAATILVGLGLSNYSLFNRVIARIYHMAQASLPSSRNS